MGIGLVFKPISKGAACGLTNNNKIIKEISCKNIIKIENNMKKVNKQVNLLISYLEKVHEIIYLMETKMNL